MKTVVDDATTVDQYCVVVGMLAGGWSRMEKTRLLENNVKSKDSLQVTIKTNLLAELKHQAPN